MCVHRHTCIIHELYTYNTSMYNMLMCLIHTYVCIRRIGMLYISVLYTYNTCVYIVTRVGTRHTCVIHL